MSATPVAALGLTVPGTLRYRDLAVRTVAEAARLVSCSSYRAPNELLDHDVTDPFDIAVVSAFSEVFNNIAIHAYERTAGGTIEITIVHTANELAIDMVDGGRTFDLHAIPLLTLRHGDTLPEGGMGIHIARTMLDELSYMPGPPNRWRLCKRLRGGSRANTSL